MAMFLAALWYLWPTLLFAGVATRATLRSTRGIRHADRRPATLFLATAAAVVLFLVLRFGILELAIVYSLIGSVPWAVAILMGTALLVLIGGTGRWTWQSIVAGSVAVLVVTLMSGFLVDLWSRASAERVCRLNCAATCYLLQARTGESVSDCLRHTDCTCP